MLWYVYTLSHPTTTETQYVGITHNVLNRYRHHLSASGKTAKDKWIRRLRTAGLVPKIDVICTCDSEVDACIKEINLIVELRKTGHNLMNRTSGGGAASKRR